MTTEMRIPPAELERIRKIVEDKILKPTLREIVKDTRKEIRVKAKEFKGTSVKGIASPSSTEAVFDKQFRAEIKPTIDHFEINKEGYMFPVYKNVNGDPDLYSWVYEKYSGKDKEDILTGRKSLRVRSVMEKGRSPPLGSVRRDFFGNAFEEILKNKRKYGLS